MADLRLASAGDDVKIWDCAGYSTVQQFNPHGNRNISSICWSRDNSIIASASTGGDKVSLNYTSNEANGYEIAKGCETFAEFPTIVMGQESRTCITFNSVARYLMGGGPDGIIHIWDLKSRKLKKSYRDHKSAVTSVQFNWNDTDIASGSETGEIILYNVVSGHGCTPLTTSRAQAIRQLAYSHFKKSLLGSVSEDGTVNLWDTNRRSLVHSFADHHKAPATGLAFSPLNEMLLVSVGLDKRIICSDVLKNVPVKTIMAENPLTSVDLMADGTTIAAGSTRGKIFIFDLRKGQAPVRTITAHKSSVQCLKFQNKNQGDIIGGTPALRGSSVKKSNSSIKSERIERTVPRRTHETDSIYTKTEQNGASTQGLDSRNNNRLDSENESVFSPLRDTTASPAFNTQNPAERDVESESKRNQQPGKLSLENYGDGLFSPLAGDSGNFSTRGNLQSLHTSPQGLGVGDPHVGSSYTTPATRYNNHIDSQNPTTSSYSNSDLHFNNKPLYRTPATGASHSTKSIDQVDTLHTQPGTRDRNPSRSHPSPANSEDGAYSEKSPPASTPPGATAATPASSSSSSKHRSRSRSEAGPVTRLEGGGGSASSFQMELVRSMIDEALDDFRDQVRRDVLNLHMDILKQFQIQQGEIRHLLQQYSPNEELMAEIERLREENDKLKKKF